MADDIEIHFDSQRGELSLECGDEAFASLRDAVLAAAKLGELTTAINPSEIRTIEITAFLSAKPPGRIGNLLIILGCGFIAAGLTFVLAVGVGTIAGWAR